MSLLLFHKYKERERERERERDIMEAEGVIVVRELDLKKDLLEVEDLERRCEVGNSGKISLFTDLHGDPISRVRHSPAFLMLVNTHLLLFMSQNSLCPFLLKKKERLFRT